MSLLTATRALATRQQLVARKGGNFFRQWPSRPLVPIPGRCAVTREVLPTARIGAVRTYTTINSNKIANAVENQEYSYKGAPMELPFMKEEIFFEGQERLTSPKPFMDLDTLPRRHIGPSPKDVKEMLDAVGAESMESFIKSVVPEHIRSPGLDIPFKYGISESEWINRAREVSQKIDGKQSLIGMGYYGTKVPEVIKRNIFECPEWYTSYTPYQAEISQGRLESQLNFQTMVISLTGLDIANASALDELTAACEAMTLAYASLSAARQRSPLAKVFLVSDKMFPQTIAGLHSRAEGLGIKIVVTDLENIDLEKVDGEIVGAMVQYPDVNGNTAEWLPRFGDDIRKKGGIVCCATDLLALTLVKPPGEWADVAFGTAQRFGVPMGLGGPHAAFFATTEEHKRKLPARLIGVSKDRLGNKAYRVALQTREQHIRRERATSNICTAQALLASMSAMYAVYHGPKGLKQIAEKVVASRQVFVQTLYELGWSKDLVKESDFDTVQIIFPSKEVEEAYKSKDETFQISTLMTDVDGKPGTRFSFDETVSWPTLYRLALKFAEIIPNGKALSKEAVGDILTNVTKRVMESGEMGKVRPALARTTPFLEQSVFNSYHSETEMLRYIHHLQSKDHSLAHAMIPLGSCTMKLNATTEMAPLSLPNFANLHPRANYESYQEFAELLHTLESDLANITELAGCSLQPNSGAQGELTGLTMIRSYFKSIGQEQRDTFIIPISAHGTNPATAKLVGFKVVPVKCNRKTGNLDIEDLKAKAEMVGDKLAGTMVTYPSTYGAFEPAIKEAIDIIHSHGGQVYMDGANMNAQVGITSPGYLGADVCHINLHKTFCIPHGGGGPGAGPVCVAKHLVPFLPSHHKVYTDANLPEHSKSIGPVSSAPFGSALILPISHSYIRMMGAAGLKHATQVGLLNANYMLKRLRDHYKILYTTDRCAHEFIIDPRPFKKTAGITNVDIAKRLMDYGFHAPTMSFPVTGTLMIEPTESESKVELDRYCDALIEIRKEIAEIEEGKADRKVNLLKMAPHPMVDLLQGDWKERGYSRERAAYPLAYLKEKKFWPPVARIDDAYGDTNLHCTCDPVPQEEGFEEEDS
ncbi:glycine decarboxylase subunit P [Arthrobotrys megalospora]